MKAFTTASILVAISLALLFSLANTALADDHAHHMAPAAAAVEYLSCHRCGMQVPADGHGIVVSEVPGGPWQECCPMCALVDIVETGNGSGTITAHGKSSDTPITIVIKEGKVAGVSPAQTVLLVGGNCMHNFIFASRENARAFVAATEWAEATMIKKVAPVFEKIAQKKKGFTNCSVCSAQLAGHANTLFSLLTTDGERLVACCGHCGLFMASKLGDRLRRATTTDFATGKTVDAQKAFYVVGNDQVVCCFPSTISFADQQAARKFSSKHGGEVMTFSQALTAIGKVMQGPAH